MFAPLISSHGRDGRMGSKVFQIVKPCPWWCPRPQRFKEAALNKIDLHGARGSSGVAQLVKNPPANAGDVRDAGSILDQEDPLEENMAIRSSILAWKISWTEEPGGLQSMGSQSQTQLSVCRRADRVRYDFCFPFFFSS